METWEQELQHHKALPNSFEGWYFRVSDRSCSLAIIVGISYDETDTHSFIQTIDTVSKKSQYLRFSCEEFLIDKQPFKIQIQRNIFTAQGMILHLDDCEVKIHGALAFHSLTKLSGTLYAPTIMGPFAYLPHMECIHSIISTFHKVSGNLHIQEKDMLIYGNGYIEKDRGISFPKEYIWIQSNECVEQNATLFLAIAHIPLRIFDFQGIIAFLQIDTEQYRFGSYYGASIHMIKKSDNELYFVIKQRRMRMYVQLSMNERYMLIAPKGGKMGPKVLEGLAGKATVHLYDKQTLRKVLHFYNCGNEVH